MQHEQDRMRLEVPDDVGAWLHADKSRLVTLWGSLSVGGFGEAQSIRMADKDRRQVRSGQGWAPADRGAVLARAWKYSAGDDRQSKARARMPLCLISIVVCSTVLCLCHLAASEGQTCPSCPVLFCPVLACYTYY